MHQDLTLVYIVPCNFPRLARSHYSYFGLAGQWLPKLADWAARVGNYLLRGSNQRDQSDAIK